MGVRAAGADDVPEIARIQVLTWTTAYRPFLPEAVLAGLTEERAAGAWAAAVGAPPPYRVLVAYEQDWTVGFAAIGPSGEEDASPGDAAVAALLGSRAGAGAATAAGCSPPPSTTCARTG